jgi:hypothetical protein
VRGAAVSLAILLVAILIALLVAARHASDIVNYAFYRQPTEVARTVAIVSVAWSVAACMLAVGLVMSGMSALAVALDLYGLRLSVSYDANVSYMEVRNAILQNTVVTLADVDPHFPFLKKYHPEWRFQWSLPTDDANREGGYDRHLAVAAFAHVTEALWLKAPVIIALEERPHPVYGEAEHNRRLWSAIS